MYSALSRRAPAPSGARFKGEQRGLRAGRPPRPWCRRRATHFATTSPFGNALGYRSAHDQGPIWSSPRVGGRTAPLRPLRLNCCPGPYAIGGPACRDLARLKAGAEAHDQPTTTADP